MRDLCILGAGYVGSAVARRARDAWRVQSYTRSGSTPGESHGQQDDDAVLRGSAVLDAAWVASVATPNADVLVAFPPDDETDERVAPALSAARSVIYVSTTGVYGRTSGHVDEVTPVDRELPRAASRLRAEDAYRAIGATVLRCAGIYGRDRGIHVRIAKGEFRMPGDGTNVVSRIHVDDLAEIIVRLFDRGIRNEVFVVGDDTPVPQIEAIAWICDRLRIPLPPRATLDDVSETLRHDRRVDNARIKRAVAYALRYPSYREGFDVPSQPARTPPSRPPPRPTR